MANDTPANDDQTEQPPTPLWPVLRDDLLLPVALGLMVVLSGVALLHGPLPNAFLYAGF